MPNERAPTPQSHTTISVGNSSEDKNSERSVSIATVEISGPDGSPESYNRTPSENDGSENVSRHRIPMDEEEESKKYVSNDMTEIDLENKRSTGISKGVILNAMNFGSYDLKCASDDIKQKTASKQHELNENGSVPKPVEAAASSEKGTEGEKDGEKKEMSLKRKIAFGFSFLPSVMFVLTFAVILPCDELKSKGHCVNTMWTLVLNQTDVTSYLSLPESLLLGYQFVNSSRSSAGLLNLNQKTSNESWKVPLISSPESLKCINLDANQDGVEDCLMALKNGNICAFNLSNGHEFWTSNYTQSQDAIILLSGCSNRVAVASYSRSEDKLGIYVLSETDGSVIVPTKEVLHNYKCANFSMKIWEHDNKTDLIYLCRSNRNLGHIALVRQNVWCPVDETEESTVKPQILNEFDEYQTEILYQPTDEGLILWSGNNVTFFELDGTTQRWHAWIGYDVQNRIVKYGSFYVGGDQIALIGQNSSYGIVVSIVESRNGKELNTATVLDRTLNQVVLLPGNETSSLLMSVSKTTVTETEEMADKEVVLLSNINSTSDFRTDAPYKVNGKRNIVEELILLQFERKNTTHVVLEMPFACDEGDCEAEYQSSHIISAVSEEEEENLVKLKVIMLKSSNKSQNGSQSSSELTTLSITHQDTTNEESRFCQL